MQRPCPLQFLWHSNERNVGAGVGTGVGASVGAGDGGIETSNQKERLTICLELGMKKKRETFEIPGVGAGVGAPVGVAEKLESAKVKKRLKSRVAVL